MYIREKQRKTSSGKIIKYAYLVKSKRRRRSKKPPKQKIVAYLGKIIELKDHEPKLKNKFKTPKSGVLDLLKQILHTNGFKGNYLIFQKNDIKVDLKKYEVSSQNRKICLKVNDGFITSPTLREILNYRLPEKKESEIALDLAKKLVFCGIKPNRDDFITIYNKLHKKQRGR